MSSPFNRQPTLSSKSGQLGDVGGNPPSFIKRQSLRGFSLALIGVAVDIGKSLSIRIHDLKAAEETPAISGPTRRQKALNRYMPNRFAVIGTVNAPIATALIPRR